MTQTRLQFGENGLKFPVWLLSGVAVLLLAGMVFAFFLGRDFQAPLVAWIEAHGGAARRDRVMTSYWRGGTWDEEIVGIRLPSSVKVDDLQGSLEKFPYLQMVSLPCGLYSSHDLTAAREAFPHVVLEIVEVEDNSTAREAHDILSMRGAFLARKENTPAGSFAVIDLSLADLAAEDLHYLRAFPELRRLTLRGTQLSDKAVSYLQELAPLESLRCIGPPLSDVVLETLRASWPACQIEVLDAQPSANSSSLVQRDVP